MKILDNYIIKELLNMILLVALALLGIDLFFYFINELRFVGKGNYGVWQAFCFVLLTIPRKLYITLPWSALLGTLLALGNLARNNELLAIRVAAISIHRISFGALKGALWLLLIGIILGELIAPVSENFAQQQKTKALSKGQTIDTEFGMWIRNDNEFIHIGSMTGKILNNIEKYKFDNQLKLEEVVAATSAYQNDHKAWQLENIKGTKFLGHITQNFTAKELIVTKLLDLNILEAAQVKHLERLSLRQLSRIIKHRALHELNTQSYKIALWNKLFQPLVVLVMVYLAIPFVFGPLRRASMGLKLLTGVLVGFGFYTVHAVFTQLPTVVNLSPCLAMGFPPFLFLVIGFLLLIRVK